MLREKCFWVLFQALEWMPCITRLDAFKVMATEPMENLTSDCEDDFSAGRIIEVPCGEKTLIIDWSKPTGSLELFSWK